MNKKAVNRAILYKNNHLKSKNRQMPVYSYIYRLKLVLLFSLVSIFFWTPQHLNSREVFYFDYAADCQPVQMLGAIIEKRRVNITWMETGALEYTVEYRKKGSSQWYTAGDVKPGQA
jgi:hypothetical protein